MKRERDATAEHDPEGADAGEPEPEDEAKEEFYDATPWYGVGARCQAPWRASAKGD